MRKPVECQGCPFYGKSPDMVPDEIHEGAAVYYVAQNPGAEEVVQGRPLVGKTGAVFEVKYLKDAGLTREDVSIGNAIRCRVGNSNDLPKLTETATRDAIRHCTAAHFRVPEGTQLIVAGGDYATWMLTGHTISDGDSSTGWRGYLCPWIEHPPRVQESPWVPISGDVPVLVTMHLARLFREPVYTLATRMDWSKIPRILRGTWPRRPPVFRESPPVPLPSAFTFDTEFWGADPSPTLIRYSLAWGVNDHDACVVEVAQHRPLVWNGMPRLVSQYTPADLRHWASLTRSRDVWHDFLIEDTVWKHAVLWSDHPHDLNYLGSIYSSFNRWKHLSASDPQVYSALDAIGLWEVDQALERELTADARSRAVWETIDRPALGEFVRAQYHGIRTDPRRVSEVVGLLGGELQSAQARARATVGWPIPQVAHQLYVREGL